MEVKQGDRILGQHNSSLLASSTLSAPVTDVRKAG